MRKTFAILLLLLPGCFFAHLPPGEHRRRAERAASAGDCDTAIKEYDAHIAERLKSDYRPAEENPYFYLLAIGDCALRLGDDRQALEKYLEAKANNIPDSSIIDRFLRLARWYGARGRYEEALELLEKYRQLDPILFESELDTLSKLIVSRDEGQSAKPLSTPATRAN